MEAMTLEWLPMAFSVCRLADFHQADLSLPFTFFARTDEELSLVCPQAAAPAAARREDGWRCFRVKGPLDFSLVGILARIAGCLAEAGVPIFAVSTFDTDYVLLKEEHRLKAAAALQAAGFAQTEKLE